MGQGGLSIAQGSESDALRAAMTRVCGSAGVVVSDLTAALFYLSAKASGAVRRSGG